MGAATAASSPSFSARASMSRACTVRPSACISAATISHDEPVLVRCAYRTVLVTSCGRLCLYRKKINLSTSLAGQAVGIKEVDNGIWLVSFMDYDLGYIDL